MIPEGQSERWGEVKLLSKFQLPISLTNSVFKRSSYSYGPCLRCDGDGNRDGDFYDGGDGDGDK